MNTTEPIAWSIEAVSQYGLMGLCVGIAYYLAQRLNLRLPLQGDQRWIVWVLDGVRLVGAIVFFGWLATLGNVPILSAFVGFLIGRLMAARIVPSPD